GPRGSGFYSFDLGAWHVVALNSNIVNTPLGKTQEVWLKANLATHRTQCTLAFFHHPRFTSGWHGNNDKVKNLWNILHDAGVDVALSGHDHDYERLAPLDKEGQLDSKHGIRQFIAGTGGAIPGLYLFPHPHSEAKAGGVYGALKLVLHPGEYEWAFMAVPDGEILDQGKAACH
ncbi:MAG: metallophosphoesterase family protein, partial [Burkholderiales bacterium]